MYDYQTTPVSSGLSEVGLQRSSTGPPVRPKPRPSLPSSVSQLGVSRPSGGFSAGRPLAQREKQMLKDDIFKLPPHKLGPVVDIISKSNANVANADDDEIEIDIDKLDVPTLRELQDYVKRALAPPPKRPLKAAQSARSPSQAGQNQTPKHSPSGSILQSPPRLQTPDRDAAPGLPQSPGSAKGDSDTRVRYESDEDSSDDDSDAEEQNGKKATPAFPHGGRWPSLSPAHHRSRPVPPLCGSER